MSHTPGPWEYRFRSVGTCVETTDGARLAIVALTLGVGDVDSNARLIAAAPALLEACRSVLGVLEATVGTEVTGGHRTIALSRKRQVDAETQLRAAIAKATRA